VGARRLSVIAVEVNHEDLETAKSHNQTGVWYFIVTHVKGKRLPQGSEKMFTAKGSWEEARAQAEVTARTYGCVDDVDSTLLVLFTP
jgi:hypothetical protein